MNAEEIRNAFGHNAVYAAGQSGYPDYDNAELMRLQIMALGELAAQLAERSDKETR